MQTIKIEVKLDGEELSREDISNFVAALIEKESLQFYSISLHTDGKEPQIEWDCPELWEFSIQYKTYGPRHGLPFYGKPHPFRGFFVGW